MMQEQTEIMELNSASQNSKGAALPNNICKLSAAMFTDIKGFSSTMGESEKLTLKLLRDHNRIMRFLARKHRGRVVKSTGDGYLLDFDSAVEAVQCAVEAQQRFMRYNAGKPEEDHITVRIGIGLGEVMIVDGDLFGDEVNIAARLQALAEPGGICITREVYERVKTKLAIVAVNLGQQELKNIRHKVDVYSVLVRALGQAAIEIDPSGKSRQRADDDELAAAKPRGRSNGWFKALATKERPLPALASLPSVRKLFVQHGKRMAFPAVLCVVVGALLVWSPVEVSQSRGQERHGATAEIKQAGIFSPKQERVHDGRSLMIALFQNRTREKRDDWLCVGMPDMITTELERNTDLRLLGRLNLQEALSQLGKSELNMTDNSVARTLAERMNCDLMLCGFFAREGKALRFDAQVFHVGTGELLLAERVRGESIFSMVELLATGLNKRLEKLPRI